MIRKLISFTAFLVIATPAFSQEGAGAVSINLPDILTGDVQIASTGASIPVPITGCSTVRIQAIAPVSGVIMSFRNPSNAEVASLALGNMTFVSGATLNPQAPLPGGVFNSDALQNPVDGTWTALFAFPPASTKTAIQLTVYCESTYSVGLAIERSQFITGEDVGIGVLVLNGTAPVTGLSPTLTVRLLPSGSPVNVSPLDNGANPDATANDGVYTGEFVFPQAGIYEIQGVVTILAAGSTVTRTVKKRVTVNDGVLSTNNITTQLALTGGCVTGMNVPISVNVLQPGTYLSRVVLGASNGQQVVATRVDTFAGSGASTITVPFPIEMLRQLGVNGPYAILQVRIDKVENDKFTLAFLRQPAGNTIAVAINQFCSSPIEIVGGVTATPSLVGNFISALTLTFTVKASTAGTYTSSFKVIGANGEDLGLYSQARYISAGGTATYSQSVDSFTFLNADGPYSITSLLLSGPQSAQFSNIGSTQVFSRWQFLPRVAGDLDGDGDVDAADRALQATFRNQPALSPGDRRDLNRDGKIDILDLRLIQSLTCAVGQCPNFVP